MGNPTLLVEREDRVDPDTSMDGASQQPEMDRMFDDAFPVPVLDVQYRSRSVTEAHSA